MRKISSLETQKTAGFTLLEVILTMGILLTLTAGASMAIRQSLDIRAAVGERTVVSHKLNIVLQKITQDIQHAFIVSTLNDWSNPVGRSTKTLFETKNDGSFRLTTMSRRPIIANAHESDQTFVVYELKENRDMPGWKNLYRGEAKHIPENFNEEVRTELLATGVTKFEITPWTGQSWLMDSRWASDKSDQRNMLPRLVRINVSIIEMDKEDAAGKDAETLPTSQLSTIVYVPRSWGLKEYKGYSGTLKWN